MVRADLAGLANCDGSPVELSPFDEPPRQFFDLPDEDRPKTTPVHELERGMRFKDGSKVRDCRYKRSAPVAAGDQDFAEQFAVGMVARQGGQSHMNEKAGHVFFARPSFETAASGGFLRG
jgi:hypothetical protein